MTESHAIPLNRGFPVSAVFTLFLLTISRLARPRRLLVLVALYLLPIGLVLLIRYSALQYDPDRVETIVVLTLLPHTLLPLSALLTASGLIQDEVEEQTLTYLLLRPIPRAFVYIAKLLASVVVTGLLASLFAVATEAAVFWGQNDLWTTLRDRAPTVAALFLLSIGAYSAIFGCLGVFFRRSLIIGIVYIISVEGIFGNIDFIVRKLTVMYYFRVLALRWLDPVGANDWSILLEAAPEASTCILVLLSTFLAFTIVAGLVFRAREFRLKTPEAT